MGILPWAVGVFLPGVDVELVRVAPVVSAWKAKLLWFRLMVHALLVGVGAATVPEVRPVVSGAAHLPAGAVFAVPRVFWPLRC